MERRVLLAIFLSFLVLYVYQALVVKPAPKPPGGASAARAANQGSSAQAGAAPPFSPATSSPSSSPSSVGGADTAPAPNGLGAGESSPPSSRPVLHPIVGDATERDVRVETHNVIAVFTNRGARLKSWRLKRYFDQQGQPQELVEKTPGQPLPFTLRVAGEGASSVNADVLNSALYTVSGEPPSESYEADAPVDLRFEYRDASGLQAVKQFQLEPTGYAVTFRAEVTDGARALAPAVDWGPAVGDIAETSRYTQKAEALLFQGGKVQRIQTKDLVKQPTYEGDFSYIGVDDTYFMTALLAPVQVKVSFQPVSIPAASQKESPRDLVAYEVEPRQAGAPLRFFVGPKDFDVLVAMGPDMTRAINFGMFSAIVVPLLRSLKWVNGYIGNYGWSIVILTIMINVILFPLQHKSIVSMRRMQEIQPQMKAIQDRYQKYKATDPEKQKMNQELMALYREKGVNPASGCLPMLLTLPVLYAMWAMLSTAIELRGAPFLGWIHDLTAHDPYYVTPILMGATQVWMMKMTPTVGADPAQQRMQMLMPVIMTVMFLWLPAGALIYYVVSNLWRIGQQYLTNSIIGPPTVRTPRPPAERRIKRKDA